MYQNCNATLMLFSVQVLKDLICPFSFSFGYFQIEKSIFGYHRRCIVTWPEKSCFIWRVCLVDITGHQTVLKHLAQQVKVGMDLTRVTLPTFILEKRSLLEMYADFFAHPEFFVL